MARCPAWTFQARPLHIMPSTRTEQRQFSHTDQEVGHTQDRYLDETKRTRQAHNLGRRSTNRQKISAAEIAAPAMNFKHHRLTLSSYAAALTRGAASNSVRLTRQTRGTAETDGQGSRLLPGASLNEERPSREPVLQAAAPSRWRSLRSCHRLRRQRVPQEVERLRQALERTISSLSDRAELVVTPLSDLSRPLQGLGARARKDM